jgi:hypothetical protein
MNTEFTKVVVGRHWESPNLTVGVTTQGIEISMDMGDFLHAVALETGNPALLLTVGALERKLVAAADEVVRKMKGETKQVM